MDQTSPLAVTQPNSPLAYGKLMCHRHQVLTRHLPGIDPTLQHVQGLLIATHIREVAVEMQQDRVGEGSGKRACEKQGSYQSTGDKLDIPSMTVTSGGAHISPACAEGAGGIAQAPKAYHAPLHIL